MRDIIANPWVHQIPDDRLDNMITEHGDALKKRHHTDDVYFAIWLEAVNHAVQCRTFMSYDDLEDWGYWDAYDAGLFPVEAAEDMLTDSGYGWE